MRPQVTEDLTGTGASDWILVDWEIAPFALGLGVEVDAGSTLTCTVQYAVADPRGGLTAEQIYPDAALASLTASALGGNPFPVRAVRLNVSAYVGGAARLRILQGDRT